MPNLEYRNGEYAVLSSGVQMPASCMGRYRYVALVRLTPGRTDCPAMISERARGIAEIIRESGPRNVGKSERCAFDRTVAEYVRECDHMATLTP